MVRLSRRRLIFSDSRPISNGLILQSGSKEDISVLDGWNFIHPSPLTRRRDELLRLYYSRQ